MTTVYANRYKIYDMPVHITADDEEDDTKLDLSSLHSHQYISSSAHSNRSIGSNQSSQSIQSAQSTHSNQSTYSTYSTQPFTPFNPVQTPNSQDYQNTPNSSNSIRDYHGNQANQYDTHQIRQLNIYDRDLYNSNSLDTSMETISTNPFPFAHHSQFQTHTQTDRNTEINRVNEGNEELVDIDVNSKKYSDTATYTSATTSKPANKSIQSFFKKSHKTNTNTNIDAHTDANSNATTTKNHRNTTTMTNTTHTSKPTHDNTNDNTLAIEAMKNISGPGILSPYFKGYWLMSLCFFLMFTAYNTMQSLASTVHGDVGSLAIATLYAVFIPCNMIAPAILRLLLSSNPAYAMFTGALPYALFAIANVVGGAGPLILGGAGIGIGGAVLWVGQAVFVSRLARDATKLWVEEGLYNLYQAKLQIQDRGIDSDITTSPNANMTTNMIANTSSSSSPNADVGIEMQTLGRKLHYRNTDENQANIGYSSTMVATDDTDTFDAVVTSAQQYDNDLSPAHLTHSTDSKLAGEDIALSQALTFPPPHMWSNTALDAISNRLIGRLTGVFMAILMSTNVVGAIISWGILSQGWKNGIDFDEDSPGLDPHTAKMMFLVFTMFTIIGWGCLLSIVKGKAYDVDQPARIDMEYWVTFFQEKLGSSDVGGDVGGGADVGETSVNGNVNNADNINIQTQARGVSVLSPLSQQQHLNEPVLVAGVSTMSNISNISQISHSSVERYGLLDSGNYTVSSHGMGESLYGNGYGYGNTNTSITTSSMTSSTAVNNVGDIINNVHNIHGIHGIHGMQHIIDTDTASQSSHGSSVSSPTAFHQNALEDVDLHRDTLNMQSNHPNHPSHRVNAKNNRFTFKNVNSHIKDTPPNDNDTDTDTHAYTQHYDLTQGSQVSDETFKSISETDSVGQKLQHGRYRFRPLDIDADLERAEDNVGRSNVVSPMDSNAETESDLDINKLTPPSGVDTSATESIGAILWNSIKNIGRVLNMQISRYNAVIIFFAGVPMSFAQTGFFAVAASKTIGRANVPAAIIVLGTFDMLAAITMAKTVSSLSRARVCMLTSTIFILVSIMLLFLFPYTEWETGSLHAWIMVLCIAALLGTCDGVLNPSVSASHGMQYEPKYTPAAYSIGSGVKGIAQCLIFILAVFTNFEILKWFSTIVSIIAVFFAIILLKYIPNTTVMVNVDTQQPYEDA